MDLEAYRRALTELPLHELIAQKQFILRRPKIALPHQPTDNPMPAEPAFPRPDLPSPRLFSTRVGRARKEYYRRYGISTYTAADAWRAYLLAKEPSAKSAFYMRQWETRCASLTADYAQQQTGMSVAVTGELERRFPGGIPTAKRTLARRMMTLNWWYVVYGINIAASLEGEYDTRDEVLRGSNTWFGVKIAWAALSDSTNLGVMPSMEALTSYLRQTTNTDQQAVLESASRLNRLYEDPIQINLESVNQCVLSRIPNDTALHGRKKVEKIAMDDYRLIPLNPIDPKLLDKRWEDARKELELSMRSGELPSSQFVYDPRLDPFKARIIQEQRWLKEPEVFAGCMELIRKMHSNYGAALLGYVFLKGALMLGGDSYVAAEVADLEVEFIEQWAGKKLGDPKPQLSLSGEDNHLLRFKKDAG